MKNDESPSGQSRIYSQGYEKWEGSREHPVPVWLLTGQTVLKNVTTHKGCLPRLLFLVGIVLVGGYYILNLLAAFTYFQMENLKDSQYALVQALVQGINQFDVNLRNLHQGLVIIPSMILIPILMIFYGSQMISKDKAANALQVYFSKAMNRMDYVLGRFFAISLLTAITSLFPSAMIIVMGIVFTTDHLAFFKEAWAIPLISGIYWGILTLVYGSITLAFSSFFNKSYMAAVGLIGFLVFCMVFALLAVQIFGLTDLLNGVNWFWSMYEIGMALYHWELSSLGAMMWRLMDLFLICGIALGLLFRNINPVEVIS